MADTQPSRQAKGPVAYQTFDSGPYSRDAKASGLISMLIASQISAVLSVAGWRVSAIIVVSGSLLASSVESRVRLIGDRIEQEEGLRTRQEFLATETKSQHSYSQLTPISNQNTHKLNVIYPSRSESYRLNTSVILFRLMQACTNRSKLSTFSRS